MGRRKVKRKSQSVAKTNAYFSRFQVKFARRRAGTSSSASRLGLSRSRDDHRAATDASVRAFVRPSGTEDYVRLYVEGEQIKSVDVLTARIREACETVLSE